MITPAQSALAAKLRGDGATLAEQVMVLATVAEVDAAIELALPWLHEKRDRRGKWTSGGGAPSTGNVRVLPRKNATPSVQSTPAPAEVAQVVSHLAEQVSTLNSQVAELHREEASEEKQIKEIKRKRTKIWSHMAVMLGGGAMAYAEAKYGIPNIGGIDPHITEIGSAISPLVVQEIVDYAKGL